MSQHFRAPFSSTAGAKRGWPQRFQAHQWIVLTVFITLLYLIGEPLHTTAGPTLWQPLSSAMQFFTPGSGTVSADAGGAALPNAELATSPAVEPAPAFFAPCTNSTAFGSTTINLSGTSVTITTCAYAGEYSTISGAVSGQMLRFTSSVGTDEITIRSGTSNGPVLASGTTPVTFSNTFTGTIFSHVNTPGCGSQSTCRTTTVQLLNPAPMSCLNSTQFPSGTVPINTSGTLTQISGCNYAGEYSAISGATAGQMLQFTSSASTDVVTVRSGTSGGTVLAEGTTPLTFTNTFTGNIFVHWNTPGCGSQNTCRITTVQLLNPVATCMLTCPANITTSNSAGQCGAVVTFANPVTTGSCGTVTTVPTSGSFFTVGTTTVMVSTTAGPTCSFTVTVNDTEPPVVTCPADISVAASSSEGAVVTFTPTATDNCSVSSLVSNPPSGSTFPIGETTVTVTATDPANNSASCTFTVTVTGLELDVLYVADTQNNRCQKFEAGLWSLVPGTTGTVGSGNGQFRLPEAIVADSTGQRIYVADTGNNRIQFTTNGGTTWQNFATLGAGASQVRAPQGLALDSLGNLYVSDTGNNRVLRFDAGVPGNAVILAAAGSTGGKVNSPRGLAIDLDFNLYVAEFQNNRIQRFANADTSAPTATLVATIGSSLSPGQVRSPESVAVDSVGNLYVADTGNNRIIVFTATTPSALSTTATLVCGNGSALGQVRAAEGVTVSQGIIIGGGPGTIAVFVSDTGNNRIQGSFSPTGPGSFVLVGSPNNVGSGNGQFRAPSKIR